MDIQDRLISYDEKIQSGELGAKFNEFYEILCNFNQMFNLTAIKERSEIYDKHFLDSVMGEFLFDEGAEAIEIGSGAGFPSIPLKLIRPDLKLTLVESTGKKCEFLRTVVDKLGLNGVKIYNARAEDLAKDDRFREKFDYATARAVARMNTLSEYCIPFVRKGGKFIAYKGDCAEEVEEARSAVAKLGGKTDAVIEYNLKDRGKRGLVVVKKEFETPKKYPRGNGKERKNPL